VGINPPLACAANWLADRSGAGYNRHEVPSPEPYPLTKRFMMLTRIRVLALAAVMLPLLPCLCAKDPVEFKPADGKFTVKFPSPPKESETKTPAGPMKMYMAYTPTSGYMVMVLENQDLSKASPELVEQALDKGRDILINKGKLVEQKKIKLMDKYPGREMLIEMAEKKGYMHLRMYLADNALYAVMVVTQKQEDATNKESMDFLDSFKLNK
jgi:hypothetical protein